jgi:LDH2 family malate/lactate/ureidoglycolate dehydrogenase
MIRALHAAPKEPGQERIYVAGEIEHETEQERHRKGIPLPANVVADLQELSRRFEVPLALGEAEVGPGRHP